MPIRTVRLDAITADPGVQSRAATDQAAVEEYAELMRQGVKFPPLAAYDDGEQLWLAGGFHRHAAAQLAGLSEIECDVDTGTRDDAILYAVGSNSKHGVRRTAADKRRSVEMLLARPEWAKWSNCEIGRRCNVSESLVRAVRGELSLRLKRSETPAEAAGVTGNVSSEGNHGRTYTTRHGTTATMNTSNIGKGQRQADGSPADDAAAEPTPTTLPAAVLRDGIGLAVPERLRTVFAGVVEEIGQLQVAYRDIGRRLNKLAKGPGGEQVRRNLKMLVRDGRESFACTDLHNSLLRLLNGKPHVAECPYCHDKHPGQYAPDCRACLGNGWVTEDCWSRVPRELKAPFEAMAKTAA